MAPSNNSLRSNRPKHVGSHTIRRLLLGPNPPSRFFRYVATTIGLFTQPYRTPSNAPGWSWPLRGDKCNTSAMAYPYRHLIPSPVSPFAQQLNSPVIFRERLDPFAPKYSVGYPREQRIPLHRLSSIPPESPSPAPSGSRSFSGAVRPLPATPPQRPPHPLKRPDAIERASKRQLSISAKPAP